MTPREFDNLPRKDLIDFALWLSNYNDSEIFDPMSDEQLRLIIQQKCISAEWDFYKGAGR